MGKRRRGVTGPTSRNRIYGWENRLAARARKDHRSNVNDDRPLLRLRRFYNCGKFVSDHGDRGKRSYATNTWESLPPGEFYRSRTRARPPPAGPSFVCGSAQRTGVTVIGSFANSCTPDRPRKSFPLGDQRRIINLRA